MRVLITGATGFVGAWTARAVADAGHELVVLARSTRRVESNLGAIGVKPDEVVVGDMTDRAPVTEALDSCDAVVHAAALVSLKQRDAATMMAVNDDGARLVLGGAAERGIGPIVYVSSTSALFRPGLALLHADLPVAEPETGYARSKAAVETYARELQAAGAPIAITYPGGVLGPLAGEAVGETASSVVDQLKLKVLPCPDGRFGVVDVRDIADVHVALLQLGHGPRRYLCGGHHLSVRELVAEYRELTGQWLWAPPFPPAAMRGLGAAMDALMHVVPFETIFTHEAMTVYTQLPPVDDQATQDDLGITWRPARETLRDTIRSLHAAGLLSVRLAGPLARFDLGADGG